MGSSPQSVPASAEDDAFFLVVSAREGEDFVSLVGPQIVALGSMCSVVAKAHEAQLILEHCDVVGLLIDAELRGSNPYDLCGWVRARFRDLPILILESEGAAEVNIEAVHLSPGGGIWTISDSLRERMTDMSVLGGALESIPDPDYDRIARLTGQTPNEAARVHQELLDTLGFKTHQQMIFHVRNLPRDVLERQGHDELVVRFEPGPIVTA